MQPDDDDSEEGTSGGGAGRGRGDDVTEGVVSRCGGEVEKVVAAVDGEGVRRLISSLQVYLFFFAFPPLSFLIFFLLFYA
jgi:hypothetical protein